MYVPSTWAEVKEICSVHKKSLPVPSNSLNSLHIMALRAADLFVSFLPPLVVPDMAWRKWRAGSGTPYFKDFCPRKRSRKRKR